MAEITKNGITVTYIGSGNESVNVTATENEGLDRSAVFSFVESGGESINVTVNQDGLREVFNSSDGVFVTADDETFNALKI